MFRRDLLWGWEKCPWFWSETFSLSRKCGALQLAVVCTSIAASVCTVGLCWVRQSVSAKHWLPLSASFSTSVSVSVLVWEEPRRAGGSSLPLFCRQHDGSEVTSSKGGHPQDILISFRFAFPSLTLKHCIISPPLYCLFSIPCSGGIYVHFWIKVLLIVVSIDL